VANFTVKILDNLPTAQIGKRDLPRWKSKRLNFARHFQRI